MDTATLQGVAIDSLRSGDWPAAIAALDRLCAREPDQARHFVNLGTAQRAMGAYSEALNAYVQATALGERSVGFRYNLALLHVDLGDFATALLHLDSAHAEEPDDHDIALALASARHELMDRDAALAALARMDACNATAEQRLRAALLLLNLGEQTRAAELVKNMEADGATLQASQWLKLAQLYERSNRVADARHALQRARAIDASIATSEDGLLLGAQLAARAGDKEAAVEGFERAARLNREPSRAHLFAYPLAKALDASGQYAQAMAQLERAHKAQVHHLHDIAPRAVQRRRDPLPITRRGGNGGDIAAWRHDDAPGRLDSPVFLLGFPRSGTTLMEQALDAHPALVSMDEQPFLQYAIDVLLEAGLAYPEAQAGASAGLLASARDRYWQSVARRVHIEPGQRLLDKNPLNLLRLPAIARLFPDAQIILALRHPFDVLRSCYMQHFRAPEFAAMCADLQTLALGYRRAFDAWYREAALHRLSVIEIRYEDLVGDFATGMRALAGFLTLPWHEAMTLPAAQAQRRGYISTPSYAQVLEPVSQRAIGGWRNYDRWLRPLAPLLQPYFERWQYDLDGADH
ncbi:MAG: sulfotransferase [Steroidobacteraceae bacterium]